MNSYGIGTAFGEPVAVRVALALLSLLNSALPDTACNPVFSQLLSDETSDSAYVDARGSDSSPPRAAHGLVRP